MVNNIPCFVLTVDREGGQRRRSAERELVRLGLPAVFVNGYSRNDQKISDEYSKFYNILFNKRCLTKGEISTYCGHRKIWRKFLATGAPFALVLEDDFSVRDPARFRRALKDSANNVASWHMVKLYDSKEKRALETWVSGATRFVRHRYPSAGAVAYLIRRDAAERLLRRKRFFRAVDEDFTWPWEFGLSIWSVFPNPAAEISPALGSSLLEIERQENRRRRRFLRSIWGMVLQGYKLVRSNIRSAGSAETGTGAIAPPAALARPLRRPATFLPEL